METLKNFADKVSNVEMYYMCGEHGGYYFPLEMKDADIPEMAKFLESVMDCKAKDFESLFGIPEEEIEDNADFTGRVESTVTFKDGSYLSFDGEDQNSFFFQHYEGEEPDLGTKATEVLDASDGIMGNTDSWDDILDHWKENME